MTATNDVASWLAALRRPLALVSETPALDAQALLAHLTGKPVSWLLAHPEASLEQPPLARLEAAAARLAAGEPLPYVLGLQEFYGLEFEVTPDVLIPRPETELLVEGALAWLRTHPRVHAADVGTGCGCIAVTLAVHSPSLSMVAVDRSQPALRIARQNAGRHGVADRIHFFQGDLLTAVRGPLGLVCANLPYIPTQALASLPVSAHEPRLALDGGPDGLVLIRRLLGEAPRLLAPGSLLLLEIEAGQGPAALTLAHQAFPNAEINLKHDLAKHDRLVWINIKEI